MLPDLALPELKFQNLEEMWSSTGEGTHRSSSSCKSQKRNRLGAEFDCLPASTPPLVEGAVIGGPSAKRQKQLHGETAHHEGGATSPSSWSAGRGDARRCRRRKKESAADEPGGGNAHEGNAAAPKAVGSKPARLTHRKSDLVDESLKAEMDKAVGESNAFSWFHLRVTVVLQGCSFIAFACMLTVEWIATLRAADRLWSMELTLLGRDVIFYDADLTASTRLLVLTGNIDWRDNYNLHVVPLDIALGDVVKKAPDIAEEFTSLTLEANTRLIDLEVEAMRLSLTDLPKARSIVFGDDYVVNKKRLLNGIEVLNRAIAAVRDGIEETEAWWSVLSIVLVVLAFLLEVAVTVGVQALDRKLLRLANRSRHASQEFQHAAREQFISQLKVATSNVVGHMDDDAKQNLKAWDSDRKGRKADNLLRRLAWIGLGIDLIGVVALGIPSVLTIMALVKAGEAEILQKVTMHMRTIQYFDLELTTNARLAALTSEAQWGERYDTFVGPFDAELAALQALQPELVDAFTAATSAANAKLIDLETRALETFRSNASLAQSILFGEEYTQHKGALLAELADLRGKVDKIQELQERAAEDHEDVARVLMIVCSVAVIGTNLARSVIAGWQSIVVDSEEDRAEVEEDLLMENMRDLLGHCITKIQQLQEFDPGRFQADP